MKKNKFESVILIGSLVMVPFLFAIPPAVGWWIGSWLDDRFHTAPLFEFLLIVLGFLTGAREVYKTIKRFGDFSE